MSLAAGYLWTWALARLVTVSRQYPKDGGQVGGRLTAANSGLLPAPWVTLDDCSTLPGHELSLAVAGLGCCACGGASP